MILDNIPNIDYKGALLLATSILALINGIIILRNYLRDRPKLKVIPVSPDYYQWWFRLKNEKHNDKEYSGIGFLVYLDIVNEGLRDVSLKSWELEILTKNNRIVKLPPLTIPQPTVKLHEIDSYKHIMVLGQNTQNFSGSTLIKSGCMVSGMAYYYFFGFDKPIIKDEFIKGEIRIKDVFNNKNKCKIIFREKSLAEVKKLVPLIDKIPY